MTTATFNGRIIGQAERAIRAALEDLLVPHDIDFTSMVTTNLLAMGGGRLAEADLVEQLATGLRISPAAAGAAIDATVTDGLTERSPASATVALTPVGAERHARVQAETEALSDRLYGDLPDDDLATAGRVLLLITERATAVRG